MNSFQASSQAFLVIVCLRVFCYGSRNGVEIICMYVYVDNIKDQDKFQDNKIISYGGSLFLHHHYHTLFKHPLFMETNYSLALISLFLCGYQQLMLDKISRYIYISLCVCVYYLFR